MRNPAPILLAWTALLALQIPPLSADTHVSGTQAADAYTPFRGIWGTPQQCTRAPVKPGGTVLAEPLEIGPDWLRQGQTTCLLDWFPVQEREGGHFTGAQARCGEDAIRNYMLRMELSAGGELVLRWGLLLENGPLRRCPIP